MKVLSDAPSRSMAIPAPPPRLVPTQSTFMRERLGASLRDAGVEVATLVLMQKEDLTADFIDRPIPCTSLCAGRPAREAS